LLLSSFTHNVKELSEHPFDHELSDLVMEQMVRMLIGPATIFSLGQLIVAGMTIAYTATMIPSSNAFSLNVE
jgi:hypothetical protein